VYSLCLFIEHMQVRSEQQCVTCGISIDIFFLVSSGTLNLCSLTHRTSLPIVFTCLSFCWPMCLLITREREGRLSPNFQFAPRDDFTHKKLEMGSWVEAGKLA